MPPAKPGKLNVLSNDEIKILKRFVETLRKQKVNVVNALQTQQSFDLGQTPDIYIAKTTESSGIPPMTPALTEDDFDVPGYAQCDIYNIIYNDDQQPELKPVTSLKERTVFNLSLARVPQGCWIRIQRTKFGQWIVAGMCTGLISVTKDADVAKGATSTFTIANPTTGDPRTNSVDEEDRTVEVFVELGDYTTDKVGYADYVDGVLKLINTECAT